MAGASSSTDRVPTLVCFNDVKRRAYGFTESTITLEQVGDCLVTSEIIQKSLLSQYDIYIYDEIFETDIPLTNLFLKKEKPWKLPDNHQGVIEEKKVKLTLVRKNVTQFNSEPILPSSCVTRGNSHTTTASADEDQEKFAVLPDDGTDESQDKDNNAGNLDDDFLSGLSEPTRSEVDSSEYFFSVLMGTAGGPLKLIVDLADDQRLVYPSDNPRMLQIRKVKKSDAAHPYLQIPQPIVDFMNKNIKVSLVIAAVVKVVRNGKEYFWLDPYRGFWELDDNARCIKGESLFNPLILPIKKESLKTMSIDGNYENNLLELKLCLVHMTGKSNDRGQRQLVRFDEKFALEKSHPVPCSISYASAQTVVNNTNNPSAEEFDKNDSPSAEELNKNKCCLICSLDFPYLGGMLNWDSHCESNEFTIENRSPYQPKKQRQA